MQKRGCNLFIGSLSLGIGFALPAGAQVIDYSGGFTNTANLTANQNYVGTIFTSSVARLNNGAYNTAASVFYNAPVNITAFTNTFTFRLYSNSGVPGYDGITFVLQNDPRGKNAIGNQGGNLGYSDPFGAGISSSVAVKFDIYQNSGDPSDNSTGLFTDGQTPIGGTDLNGTGINLKSGDGIRTVMTYSGTTLSVTLTDTATLASTTETYSSLDIASIVGSNTAYAGFTGGTGEDPPQVPAVQEIRTWQFASNAMTPEPGSWAIGVSALIAVLAFVRGRAIGSFDRLRRTCERRG